MWARGPRGHGRARRNPLARREKLRSSLSVSGEADSHHHPNQRPSHTAIPVFSGRSDCGIDVGIGLPTDEANPRSPCNARDDRGLDFGGDSGI